jgi:phosphatidate cytidylyltransferase
VPELSDPNLSEPSAAPSRAGRNLPLATAVGVVLAALVVGTVTLLPVGWVVVVSAAFAVAVIELCAAADTAGAHPARTPLVAGSVAMAVSAYYAGLPGLALAFAGTLLAVIFWRLFGEPSGAFADVTASAWIAGYPALLGSFVLVMYAQPHGAARVIVFIAVTVCSDVGGYALGVLRGRHSMAPRISPKKSWEGFAGSVIACLLGGWLVTGWLLHTHPWQGLLVGLAVVVAATMGDLAESMVKRDLGIKDMGTFLPGHGGMMDRLDSLIPVAPVVFVLLSLFVGR